MLKSVLGFVEVTDELIVNEDDGRISEIEQFNADVIFFFRPVNSRRVPEARCRFQINGNYCFFGIKKK